MKIYTLNIKYTLSQYEFKVKGIPILNWMLQILHCDSWKELSKVNSQFKEPNVFINFCFWILLPFSMAEYFQFLNPVLSGNTSKFQCYNQDITGFLWLCVFNNFNFCFFHDIFNYSLVNLCKAYTFFFKSENRFFCPVLGSVF